MRESRQGAVVATAALDVEGDPALPRRAFTVKRSKFCWRLKQKSSPTKVYPSCISSSIFLLDTILFFTINRLIMLNYTEVGKNVPDKSLTSMHLTLPLPLDLYVASLNQACKRALDGVADEGTPASARTGDWGRGKARLCFFHFPWRGSCFSPCLFIYICMLSDWRL